LLDTPESRFDEFFAARMPSLVRALWLTWGDLGRAEDCAQEAFVRAWQRWRQLEDDDPVAWVRTVAWRLCVDDWRARRRRSTMPGLLQQHAATELQDDLDRSRSLLIGLPQHHAAVLVLHYLEDLEVDEIAKMLGIPVGTVKSRLSRAREALRNAQSPSEEEIQ